MDRLSDCYLTIWAGSESDLTLPPPDKMVGQPLRIEIKEDFGRTRLENRTIAQAERLRGRKYGKKILWRFWFEPLTEIYEQDPRRS